MCTIECTEEVSIPSTNQIDSVDGSNQIVEIVEISKVDGGLSSISWEDRVSQLCIYERICVIKLVKKIDLECIDLCQDKEQQNN